MEVLFEVIFALFGGVIEFLFSTAFQIIIEILSVIFDYGSGKKASAAKAAAPAVSGNSQGTAAPASGWWSALIFVIWAASGIAAGFLSLWLSPNLFLQAGWPRYINLLLMPLICGALTQALDNWREKPDSPAPALNGFVRGFIFAFAMTAVRFTFGK